MNAAQKVMIYAKMSMKAMLLRPSAKTLSDTVKYFPDWWGCLGTNRNTVSDMSPWFAFSAIEFIKKNIRPDMKVFEYGSGGSTLFWSSHVSSVVSVEHEPFWYKKMKDKFEEMRIKNVTYILAEPENDIQSENKDFANPNHYISSDAAFAGKNFLSYVQQIDRFPNQSFDIIVVDGRARPSCILHSLSKLKEGGYLVVDNSEREYYLSSFTLKEPEWNVMKFYGPVPYIYHFSETTIFQKKDFITTPK